MINFKDFLLEAPRKKPIGESPEAAVDSYNEYVNRPTIKTLTDAQLDLDLSNKRMRTLPSNMPSAIQGDLYLGSNLLSTFENFPKRFLGGMGIDLYNNKFTSLHGIQDHILGVIGKEGINLANNPIKSHVLGLLKIKGLRVAYFGWAGAANTELKKNLHALEAIINKYLPEGDLLDCQEELIEAGLEEYAQL